MDALKPFVLPVPARTPSRSETLDVYLPDDLSSPRPAILFVPGGPLPPEVQPRPRDWPIFQGYGSLAASRGVIGAVVTHGLLTVDAYPAAADDIRAAVGTLRDDPRVDGDRVALWFFSGGSLLAADWLREPPAYVRALGLTYPLLAPFPGWPVSPRFDPIDAVPSAGDLPIVLTRVALESPAIAPAVKLFVDAAPQVHIVDAAGRHGFDFLDDNDDSRAAIVRAFDLVHSALTSSPTA